MTDRFKSLQELINNVKEMDLEPLRAQSEELPHADSTSVNEEPETVSPPPSLSASESPSLVRPPPPLIKPPPVIVGPGIRRPIAHPKPVIRPPNVPPLHRPTIPVPHTPSHSISSIHNTDPTPDAAPEPVSEPISEPITDSKIEPISEREVQPFIEPVPESTIEPTVDPIIETIIEPKVETLSQPAFEFNIEPIAIQEATDTSPPKESFVPETPFIDSVESPSPMIAPPPPPPKLVRPMIPPRPKLTMLPKPRPPLPTPIPTPVLLTKEPEAKEIEKDTFEVSDEPNVESAVKNEEPAAQTFEVAVEKIVEVTEISLELSEIPADFVKEIEVPSSPTEEQNKDLSPQVSMPAESSPKAFSPKAFSPNASSPKASSPPVVLPPRPPIPPMRPKAALPPKPVVRPPVVPRFPTSLPSNPSPEIPAQTFTFSPENTSPIKVDSAPQAAESESKASSPKFTPIDPEPTPSPTANISLSDPISDLQTQTPAELEPSPKIDEPKPISSQIDPEPVTASIDPQPTQTFTTVDFSAVSSSIFETHFKLSETTSTHSSLQEQLKSLPKAFSEKLALLQAKNQLQNQLLQAKALKEKKTAEASAAESKFKVELSNQENQQSSRLERLKTRLSDLEHILAKKRILNRLKIVEVDSANKELAEGIIRATEVLSNFDAFSLSLETRCEAETKAIASLERLARLVAARADPLALADLAEAIQKLNRELKERNTGGSAKPKPVETEQPVKKEFKNPFKKNAST